MTNLSSNSKQDLALLLLRVGVGIIFIVAGWGKLTGIEGTQSFFGNLGIPLPGQMAWVVGIVEFVGGIMVLLGTYVRIPALILGIVMVVALLTTKLGGEFRAARLDLMLMLVSFAIMLMGAGRYAVPISGRTVRESDD